MKIFIAFMLCAGVLYAKELFLPKHIYQYLNHDNPFYYQAIGEQYIAKGKERMSKGVLDTQLNAQYDDKRYPLTTGVYEEVSLLKSFENGIEFSAGYRKAKGTQEYNNIKTGKDGEIISSIKIPLLSVLNDISKNRVTIQTAQINTLQSEHKAQLNLLKLYFNVSKIYYQILLQKALVSTQKELLLKANKTKSFILKQIKTGSLPTISKIEIEQIITQREQYKKYEENQLEIVINIFLQYLGMDKREFRKRFSLPSINVKTRRLPKVDTALEMTIHNRPDLKIIDSEIEKLALKKEYNELGKYPKFDVKFSGVHDSIDKEGYKVSLNFNFPLERSQYKGMDEVLQKENLMKKSERLKVARELKTNILNVYQKIKNKKEVMKLSKKELRLMHKLESIEVKKLYEGVGNLIFLNQREISTLKVEQKLLKDYYDFQVYYLEFKYLIGKL